MYYDRDGQPITSQQWGELFTNLDYKVVQQDKVNGYFISTVWLGMNHAYGLDSPLAIFESMVFNEGSYEDLDCIRYATEAEAKAGHLALVEQYS